VSAVDEVGSENLIEQNSLVVVVAIDGRGAIHDEQDINAVPHGGFAQLCQLVSLDRRDLNEGSAADEAVTLQPVGPGQQGSPIGIRPLELMTKEPGWYYIQSQIQRAWPGRRVRR